MPTAKPPAAFSSLGLDPRLLTALTALGYEEPTPIQQQAIPPLLEGPRRPGPGGDRHRQDRRLRAADPPAIAAEPAKGTDPVALILVPTRELAMQVAEAVHRYGKRIGVRVLPVYGGASMDSQLRALAARRRRRRRDAGPRARPRQPQDAAPRVAPDAGPRRGRRDARHGLRRRPRGDPRGDARGAPDGALLGDAAAAHRHDRGEAPREPRAHRDRPRDDGRRQDAQGAPDGLRRRARPQARRARTRARPRVADRRPRLLPHAPRGRRPDRELEGPRPARRGAPRRHLAGRARPRDEEAARPERSSSSSRPTSPRAASTSAISPTSSTTTCRRRPTSTSTASAARAAPGARASRSRWPSRASTGS